MEIQPLVMPSLIGRARDLRATTKSDLATFKKLETSSGPNCGTGGTRFSFNRLFLAEKAIGSRYVPVQPDDISEEFLKRLGDQLEDAQSNPDSTFADALIEICRQSSNMEMKYLDANAHVLRSWPIASLRALIRSLAKDCAAGVVPVVQNAQTTPKSADSPPTYDTSKPPAARTKGGRAYNIYCVFSPFESDIPWRP
jgi:hypothetical protein